MFNAICLWVLVDVACSNVESISPFPELSSSMLTHTTYLDTTGRPAVILAYKDLTDKHTGMIYVSTHLAYWVRKALNKNCVQVSYQVPFSAHLKKPVSVSAAFFSLFALAFMARRIDLRLHKK
jgi:oligosaccharyltransferase complex subunit alpha (ribophorin I)